MGKKPRASEQHFRSVRVDESEVHAVMDELDSQAPDQRAGERKHKRFTYRASNCMVSIAQPGAGRPLTFRVPTRNLSEEGISFMHGGFVHPGSACVVQLVTVQGATVDVRGEVTRARYVGNWMHEISVRFTQPIRPVDFCPDAEQLTVVLGEADDAIATVAGLHLEELGAEVHRVEDGGLAIQKGLELPADCVILDIDLPGLDAIESTARLRDGGFKGRIIVLSGRTEPEARERALEAGCDLFHPKLVTPEHFGAILDTLRAGPIVSEYLSDESLKEIVMMFLETLPSRIREMEEALVGSDLDGLRATVCELKTQAAACGFEPIAEDTITLERALHGADAVSDEIAQQLEEILVSCMRARSGAGLTRPSPPGDAA